METSEETRKIAQFVTELTRRLDDKAPDKAFRAAMRRADNPNTEMQAWRYLAPYDVIEFDIPRKAFALVGGVMARGNIAHNGKQSLGGALRLTSRLDSKAKESDPAERRFQRIAACNTIPELLDVLRTILPYLVQQEKVSLDFIQLLKDILNFNTKTKLAWARDFYSQKEKEGTEA